MPKTSRPLAERFWEKVEKSDGCWLWKAALNHGYGVIGEGGRRGRILIASRVSWELSRGVIPPGMDVLHSCPGGDNKACVNPDHLYLGTSVDNGRDASHRGQLRPHPKLTAEAVMAIRARHAAGETQRALATEYGIAQGQVGRIVHGTRWTYLPVMATPGRPKGERSWSAKLTADDVRAIKARPLDPPEVVAVEYGVSPAAIRDIFAGRSWKHVA